MKPKFTRPFVFSMALLVVCGVLLSLSSFRVSDSLLCFSIRAEQFFHLPSNRAPAGFQFLRLLRASIFAILSCLVFWATRKSLNESGQTCNWLARAIICLGFFLRFDLWATKDFWCDTWALKTAIQTHSALEILTGRLGFNQAAPVGFSLLEKAVGVVSGYSGTAMTLPLLLAGCASLAALSRVTERCGSVRCKMVSLVMLFVFAVNPSFVYYSAELKPYGFDLLVSALAVLLVIDFQNGESSWKKLVCFSAFAPWFSLPSFFVLFSLYAALAFFFFSDHARIRCLVLCAAISGALAIFPLIHAFATMPAAMDNVQDLFAPVTWSKGALLWWTGRLLHFFRGPAYFGFTSWSLFSPFALLSLIPLGLFSLGVWQRRRDPLVWMSLLCIAFTFFASACHYWKINPGTSLTGGRLILFLTPFAYLPLASGLHWMATKNKAAGAATCAFALVSACLWFFQQTPISCPMNDIATRVTVQRKPGDIILCDEIMLLALISENAERTIKASEDILMVYSSPSYDDVEFASLDHYLPRHRRKLDSEREHVVSQMLSFFSEGGHASLLVYPTHKRSADMANGLSVNFSNDIIDAVIRPWVAFVRL